MDCTDDDVFLSIAQHQVHSVHILLAPHKWPISDDKTMTYTSAFNKWKYVCFVECIFLKR